MIARLGLLAILPIFAFFVYQDGQNYDPATLTFAPSPGSASQKYLPPHIGDHIRSGQVRLYSKDNLFEYINGHAEFFIGAGFKSLAMAGYKIRGASDPLPIYNVDIFDVGSPENAFGVLTEESINQESIDIGYMGFKSSKSISFIKGSYFIKVTSFKKGSNINEFAKSIEANIKSVKTILPQFARFPTHGAVPDGKSFIRSDYMGLDFLNNVFEQSYEVDGKRFHAFLISPEEGAERFIQAMIASTEDNGATITPFTLGGARGWEIADKYEGTWALIQNEKEFIGVREMKDKKRRENFLLNAVGNNKTK